MGDNDDAMFVLWCIVESSNAGDCKNGMVLKV